MHVIQRIIFLGTLAFSVEAFAQDKPFDVASGQAQYRPGHGRRHGLFRYWLLW